MKTFIYGCIAIVFLGAISGCAASAAAEEGVADHKNHVDELVPTLTKNGSFMAAKRISPATKSTTQPTTKTAPAAPATATTTTTTTSPATSTTDATSANQ